MLGNCVLDGYSSAFFLLSDRGHTKIILILQYKDLLPETKELSMALTEIV